MHLQISSHTLNVSRIGFWVVAVSIKSLETISKILQTYTQREVNYKSEQFQFLILWIHQKNVMKGVTVAQAGAPFEIVDTLVKPCPGPREILVKSLVAGMNPMYVWLDHILASH